MRGDLARLVEDAAHAGLVAVVLWLPAIIDAVAGEHNPWNIAKGLATPGEAVGVVHAVGLVGRYVRPDGPWMGGVEMSDEQHPGHPGFRAATLVAAVVLLLGCVYLARRRRLADAEALATMALVLVAGSIPATARLPLPLEAYLVQWLKVIGAVVWFAVAWTAWRAAEPWLRAQRARVVAAGAVVGW